MVPTATSDFYRAQQRLAVVAVKTARRAWAKMGADFDRSWLTVGPQLVTLSTAVQLAAARAGAAYVPAAVAELDLPDSFDGLPDPRGFAGVAADGRSLDGLLYGAVTEAKTAVAAGDRPASALSRGGRWLDMATHTLVADAGRQSSGVAIVAAPPRVGWVRMVNPPCCSRCAVLAGKFFKANAGFDRHPRCDCTHIPSTEAIAGDLTTDAQALARSGRITDLTATESQAIADGADLAQLVNARRGKSGLRGMTTTEGTSRRGLAGQRLEGAARLTPEGIYAQAGSDRAEALRLLRANGYLL